MTGTGTNITKASNIATERTADRIHDGSQKNRRWFTTFRFLFLTFVLLVIGSGSLVYPFGRDQAEYAYIADAWLAGATVYEEVLNVKPPMTHLLHAFAVKTFGHAMISIRLLDLLWQVATALVLIKICALLFANPYIGVCAATLYTLLYFSFDFWNTAETDGFINLPLALSFLASIYAFKNRQWTLWTLSGSLIAIAFLFKYTIGFFLVFTALVIVLHVPTPFKSRIRALIWFFAGFTFPLLLYAAKLATEGALYPFVSLQLGFVSNYTLESTGTPWNLTKTFLDRWMNHPLLVLSTAILPFWLLYRLKTKRYPETLLLGLWWLSGIISIVVQNKYFEYHTLVILPSLSIMTSDRIMALKGWFRGRASGWILTILILSLFAAIIRHIGHPPAAGYFALKDVLLGRSSIQTIYESDLFKIADINQKVNWQVSQFVRKNTAPADKIYVWGSEPAIYFLSERLSSSRFFSNYALHGWFAREEYRSEFLKDLSVDPPIFFLIVKNDSMPVVTGATGDSYSAYLQFEDLRKFTEKYYRTVRVIEDFTIYSLSGTAKIETAELE